MEEVSIYLAAPLFGIAERHHNLLLARELEALGYLVVLPQKEALKFFNGKAFDVMGICKDCRSQSINNKVVVANIDGPDADAGTSVEVGMAHMIAILRQLMAGVLPGRGPKVICVRTDFRTDTKKEIGYNAMFNLADRVVYKPAYVNSLEEVTRFYKELAQEIDEAIKEAMAEGASNV